ncbi:MAG: D-alanyl-D-alanine carboxypeptidase/D-alanyl-D-alanine-endopeptidase [Candidatus Obscuribacterales bacterium]
MRKAPPAFLLLLLLLIALLPALALPSGAEADSAAGEPAEKSADLDAIVRNWLRIPTLANSHVGLELADTKTGKILYSYNGKRRFVPASVVKAITCACAYDQLGPGFTYTTVLAGEGKIEGDRLKGNLVVVASQDPTLNRADLSELVKNAVHSKGIKQIDGKIKFSGIIGGDGFNPAWLVEDWGRYWMPVSSDLVVDRNITHTEGLPSIYRSVKANSMHGALFEGLLSARYGPGWVYADRGRRSMFVYRSNHAQSPPSVTLAVANPDTFNTALIEQLLHQYGVKLLNQDIPAGGGDQVYQLAAHSSKPLSGILQTCLHKSDNLYAQQILRTLGAKHLSGNKTEKADSGLPELDTAGLVAINKWLSTFAVPGQEVLLFDGCGLARKNGASPHALNMVLRHMAGENGNGGYLALLKANDESSRGRGVYRFKTGTMDTVRCIAGILTTSGGQNLALTIMVNDHTPSVRNLRIAMTALINRLRVIKTMGDIPAPIVTAGREDPNLDISANTKVQIDQKAQSAGPPPPQKKPRARHARAGKKRHK